MFRTSVRKMERNLRRSQACPLSGDDNRCKALPPASAEALVLKTCGDVCGSLVDVQNVLMWKRDLSMRCGIYMDQVSTPPQED